MLYTLHVTAAVVMCEQRKVQRQLNGVLAEVATVVTAQWEAVPWAAGGGAERRQCRCVVQVACVREGGKICA